MDFRDNVYQARSRLAEYIDAIVVGRNEELGGELFYLMRLATAAEMSSLLHAVVRVERLQAILRDENKTFDPSTLRSELGRKARALFNRLSWAVGELESSSRTGGGPRAVQKDWPANGCRPSLS